MIYRANCPICNKEKTYKNKYNYERLKDRPCKSCANSLKAGGAGDVAPKDGFKVCIDCGESKPSSEYYTNKGSLTSICKACSGKRSNDYHKNVYRFNKYGLTEADYQTLLQVQENKCVICQTELSDPCIDHDHTTGVVRGVLCRQCNTLLGLAKDDTILLNNAINYLTLHTTNAPHTETTE